MSGHSSFLRHLDYSVLQQCMHCGLCLPNCPTYVPTRIERHSPRGRIALMRSIADGTLDPSRAFAEEMYFCLGCLACMSACPAGVDYATLFERARTEAEQSHALDRPGRRLLRRATLRWLFMRPARLRWLGRWLNAYQRSGMQNLVRRSGFLRLFPRRLAELESQIPAVHAPSNRNRLPGILRPQGRQRHRVALLTGCVQDLIFPEVNQDTAEVLARNGCEVCSPPDQPCCGSLHAHNGELESARTLARSLIDLLPPGQFDAVISNAGGCGSHLKHYGALLADDPAYAERARLWDRRLKDIHEWLDQIGLEAPRSGDAEIVNVTYHDSCHLRHGQQIARQPRAVLEAIPGVRLVDLTEADWCCGSAGVYTLTQPAMARTLQDRKLDHIARTGARIVATANPGCLLQLLQGAQRRGLPLRVVHPVSLLAEAYRREPTSVAH